MREWVFQVYSGGTGGSDVAFMIEAMAAEAEDVGDPLGDLSYLTEQRTRALEDVRVLTAEQCAWALPPTPPRRRRPRRRAGSRTTARAARSSRRSARVDELRELRIAEVEKARPHGGVLVGARTPEATRAAQRLRDALRPPRSTSRTSASPARTTRPLPQRPHPVERALPAVGGAPASAWRPRPQRRSTP